MFLRPRTSRLIRGGTEIQASARARAIAIVRRVPRSTQPVEFARGGRENAEIKEEEGKEIGSHAGFQWKRMKANRFLSFPRRGFGYLDEFCIADKAV